MRGRPVGSRPRSTRRAIADAAGESRGLAGARARGSPTSGAHGRGTADASIGEKTIGNPREEVSWSRATEAWALLPDRLPRRRSPRLLPGESRPGALLRSSSARTSSGVRREREGHKPRPCRNGRDHRLLHLDPCSAETPDRERGASERERREGAAGWKAQRETPAGRRVEHIDLPSGSRLLAARRAGKRGRHAARCAIGQAVARRSAPGTRPCHHSRALAARLQLHVQHAIRTPDRIGRPARRAPRVALHAGTSRRRSPPG